MRALLLTLLALSIRAEQFRAPAGTRPASRRPGAESILPGGRMIAPTGLQYLTGPGPWGLAVSPSGRTVVSADGGPGRYSITVLKKDKESWVTTRHVAATRRGDDGKKDEDDDWKSVFMGLAFDGEKSLYASEGNSGRVRLIDPDSGVRKAIFNLNGEGFDDSYSSDLAFDKQRGLLYVLDQANFRMVAIDTKKRRIVSSTRVGRLPFALALSPDGRRAYVTNLGMFQYSPIPGANKKDSLRTGLPFPAFGFPSEEARNGVRRETAAGPVDVPGLGDPNAKESNSLCVIDLDKPEAPHVLAFIPTGVPFGKNSLGGSSPSGVLATADRIYVSNGHNDSITVIDAKTLAVERQIEIRIPRLEAFRGILPTGLAIAGDWLLVAESGINALAVIDRKTSALLGHIPTAWFPTRIWVQDDNVYVSNARGHGTGPNATRQKAIEASFQGDLRRGAISMFTLPHAGELPRMTQHVMALNGFTPRAGSSQPIPVDIKYVVLIVKENRTFDEVFGDLQNASNGAVEAAWDLARFGRQGHAVPERGVLKTRPEIRSINVTPNHHEMANRWSISDNFYADSEMSVDGHHWLVGSYPNAWTESSRMAGGGAKDFRFPTTAPGRLQFMNSNSSYPPENQLEAGAIWHHFERNHVTFRNYGEGFELPAVEETPGQKPTGGRYLTNVPMPDPLFRNTSRVYPNYNMNIPDQFRASQFIAEIDKMYLQPGKELPQFLYIHLPNDHMAKARPEDGYPYPASFVADNDYALGRIMQFLSNTPYWKNMTVIVTEDDAQGGVDHVDSHRTVLMVTGPFAKKNYVSHVHSSFPGLLKTIFRIFYMGPLNLFDAAASDLADCFTDQPDFTPYKLQSINPALFDPAKAKDPADPQPSPIMDDPAVLRKQHDK
jgi:YVTN family beta-propeller protein